MDKTKSQNMRLWIVLGITVISLVYQVISHYAIVQNEIRHIWTTLNKIEKQIGRIEDYLFLK